MATIKDMTTEEMKKALSQAQEAVRAFHFAFPGSKDKNVQNYRKAKKTVAELLTKLRVERA